MLLTSALMLAAGCNGDRAEPGTSNATAALRGEVELTLGAADSAPEYEFSRISGLAVDTNGRIFVADLDAAEVRVFSEQGKLAYRIGRKGKGPGELDEPCCLAVRDGRLWVRDNGNTRYNVYLLGDTSATYQRMVRMAHTDVNRWAPVTFDATGHLIDVGTRFDSSAKNHLQTRFRLDSSGAVLASASIPAPPADSVPVHTVSGTMGGQRVTFFLNQPYGPSALIAHGPNGEMARAVNARYSIAWYASDGSLLHAIERRHEAPPLSAGEAARAETSIVNDMRRTKLSRQAIPYGVPERKQPLRRLFFDRDGRLWVELSVPEGSPRRADVHGRDGRLVHTVDWPAAVDLSAEGAIRGDIAHGIMRDSLDVERVVRMRLK